MSERLAFAFWAAKLTLEGDKTRPNQEKNAKKFHFARQNGIFCIICAALGIGRATVLQSNAELVNPCKARRCSLQVKSGYEGSLREFYGWRKQVVSERLRCKGRAM